MSTRKVLFIDRDGTLVIEPDDFQVDALEKIRLSPLALAMADKLLKDTEADVLINYLPVGSEQAVRYYAGQALEAGRLVRITPSSLAKTLGAPEVSEDALTIARQYGHSHVVVSDREAYLSLRLLMERAKVITELAASCTLAAAQKATASFAPEDHVALILCGGNLSLDTLGEYHRLFSDVNS